jgi:uncharacterized protein (DUF488 family)
MLNRQKVLVHLLQQAGRPVSKIELMKWCFLVRHEMPSHGGATFYDFLPYHFGPFSFCLYREIAQLVNDGLVASSDDRFWELCREADAVDGLSNVVKLDVVRILRRFSEKSTSYLVNYVYEQYPWFTVNSKKRQHAVRPVAPLAIYTAGYEGQQVDAFLNMLMRNGIQQLLDVRNNPICRRYGFHKTTLHQLCKSLDIEYAHRPELGIPAVLRRNLSTKADYEALFAKYESEVLSANAISVKEVSQLVQAKPTVLVCMEADPQLCHRTRLAKAIADTSDLPIRHLVPSE